MASARPTTANDSTPAPPDPKRYVALNDAWPASSTATSTPTTKTAKTLANRPRLDIGETHGGFCSALLWTAWTRNLRSRRAATARASDGRHPGRRSLALLAL